MEPKKRILKFVGLEMAKFKRPDIVFREQEPGFSSFVNTSRPTMVAQNDYGYGDNLFGGPTQYRWEPIELNFGHWTDENLINVIQEWFGAVNTPPPQQGYQAAVDHSRTYKRNVTIQMLDPTGIVVETYVFRGCYPVSMTLDSPYDETPELSVTINTDNCELIL
jgi:hypothetical protein